MFRTWMAMMAAVCAIVLWASACARRPAPAEPPPRYEQPVIITPSQPQGPMKLGAPLPVWVAKGSGAYQDATGRYFYGVGAAASASGNRVLMRTAADNLSRRELAGVLRRYFGALAGGKGDPGGGPDDGDVNALVEAALAKAVVTDHWNDSRDGRMYALCRLALGHLKEIIAHSGDLSTSLRKSWVDMADRQHARMVEAP